MTKAKEGNDETVLVADVGGTTTALGIAAFEKGKPKLLVSRRTATSQVKDLCSHTQAFLRDAAKLVARPRRAIIAVAGPVEEMSGERVVRMTNNRFVVGEKRLSKALRMPVIVINDFEAIAHSLPFLEKNDVFVLRNGMKTGNGRSSRKGNEGVVTAIVGAGTGLGKAIFIEHCDNIMVLRSEGGHAELPFKENQQPLRDFLMKELGTAAITWEELVSGRGLERLYRYIRNSSFKRERLPEKLGAAEIALTRNENRCAEAAWELFIRFYARCCKNFVLEAYATGGLFIAGGIAARNPRGFGETFLKEFSSHPDKQYREVLEKITITIITTPDAGLIGATAYLKRDQI